MNYSQLFLLATAIIVISTLYALRRAHIRVEYSVSWLVVGLVLFLCALFPGLLARVSFGVGLDPQTRFMILAGGLALALLFEVSLAVSRLRDENVQLVQRMAILEFQLRYPPSSTALDGSSSQGLADFQYQLGPIKQSHAVETEHR